MNEVTNLSTEVTDLKNGTWGLKDGLISLIDTMKKRRVCMRLFRRKICCLIAWLSKGLDQLDQTPIYVGLSSIY